MTWYLFNSEWIFWLLGISKVMLLFWGNSLCSCYWIIQVFSWVEVGCKPYKSFKNETKQNLKAKPQSQSCEKIGRIYIENYLNWSYSTYHIAFMYEEIQVYMLQIAPIIELSTKKLTVASINGIGHMLPNTVGHYQEPRIFIFYDDYDHQFYESQIWLNRSNNVAHIRRATCSHKFLPR